ncbi:MAG: L-arabinose transport system permease protein AraQ [Spirochaetes bacterium ADurb.Bin315]|jgi:ABC-type glycerol-3-phosphate transport system permease component|nr:carbohydrate ABC transporter permease [Spirochaetota bacterium]OQA43174.1 MAG: L-arabinose transport system permease protein AraQ [Spirochaetes bacterium ADurb.Bin315]TAH57742.1 MAG: carbohydrate ABC transporter permease [Sphaerochaeta sp.]HNZ95268.1 carbohydrate ABC transporter permease [Sphaerochaeta sp.]HOE88722.1 carbohydrate ABC transporter permease [Sphaerochaeta sp.]
MARKRRLINSVLQSLALLFISLLFVLPIVFCVFTSFKESIEIIKEVTFFPKKWSLVNYDYVFVRGAKYLKYYLNTIIITMSSVIVTLLLSALSGYSFAKLPFKGSNALLASILFVLAFPLAAILIPIYIMEYNLGLLNTYIGLILPNLLLILPFSIFIMRGTFINLSRELEDSAEIDGCSVVQTWWKIMLPLAQNALVIVFVSGFYSVWGEYTISKSLATKDSIMPISVALTLLKSEDWNYGVLAAAITMSIIPPITIFAIFQNRLVEGMVEGAIKG